MAAPPSLARLARHVGLNECKLKAGFRQVFGSSVFAYLHDCRLEAARLLLAEGNENVKQVAYRVGYSSRSYFAAAFRHRFGVNPSFFVRSCRRQ